MLLFLDRVPHVEQNFEIQLFTTIGEVERRHRGGVGRFFGTVERFAIHLFEIVQNPFTGTRHTQALEGFVGKAGRDVIGSRRAFLGAEELGQLIKHHPTTAIREIHRRSDDRQKQVKRLEIFARDEHRCVYCGLVHEPDALSVDHVQPRMRGGDGSYGNVVTACRGCNTRKGSHSLPHFLAESPEARRNFFQFARYVWPRHLIAVAEDLARRGVMVASTELVEGIRGLRSSEAIASVLRRGERTQDPEAE